MYTLLSLASVTGTLTDESIDNAEKLAEETQEKALSC